MLQSCTYMSYHKHTNFSNALTVSPSMRPSPRAINASEMSGCAFQVDIAVTFPRLKNADVVSHPVNAWNAGSATVAIGIFWLWIKSSVT